MTLTVYTCHCGQKHYGRSIFNDKNTDSECQTCFDLSQSDELVSDDAIRCPMCGEGDRDDLWEINGLYSEGETEVMCCHCNYEYCVDTAIQVTFTSPELIQIFHGTKENVGCGQYDPRKDEDHRFECIFCKRTCCACFGSACDVDEQSRDGEGICCDCWVASKEGTITL